MTEEEIKQELIEQGKDPADFTIKIYENRVSVTPKPSYEAKKIIENVIKKEKIKERIEGLEKGIGVGQPGQKGVAQRIDDLESRIKALEENS